MREVSSQQHQLVSLTRLVPLPLWQALLMFGIPAVLTRFTLYTGSAFLIQHGISQAAAVYIGFGVPTVLVLIAAFAALRLDGYALSWPVLKERFRLHHMTWRAWLWSVGGLVVALVASQVLAFTGSVLVRIPPFTPPAQLAFLNPTVHLSLATFLGVPMRGNWGFLLAFTFLVILQVVAEECWWRGYIFPRQEQVYGKWTWLVHGLLWTGFHVVFYPWNLFPYLFFCTTVAFVVQRTRNTWSSFFIHFLYNSLTPIALLLAVLGILH